jgi:hypothetical protein
LAKTELFRKNGTPTKFFPVKYAITPIMENSQDNALISDMVMEVFIPSLIDLLLIAAIDIISRRLENTSPSMISG